MADVFAAVYHVRARQPDGSKRFASAVNEWLQSKRPVDQPEFKLEEGQAYRTDDGSILRWEPFSGEGSHLLELTFRHASRDDNDISWSTQAAFIEIDGRQMISLRVSNTGPEPGQAGALLTTRPRLVHHLVDQFAIVRDGLQLNKHPRTLAERDVSTFVRYELFDPGRGYPIMVVAMGADRGFAARPVSVAEEFLGMAEVVVLDSSEAAHALTHELGDRRLSCFDGGIRLYEMGLSKTSDPYRHPLLLAKAAGTPSARLRLAHHVAVAMASRYRVPTELLRLRDERAVAQSRMHGALMEQLARAKSLAEDAELARMIQDDNVGLARRVDELEEKLEDATKKIAGLKLALQAARGESTTVEAAADFVPESVVEAVEYAQGLAPDGLRILDSAVESASRSPFRDPAAIWRALQSLGAVAERLRSGPLGRNLDDVFIEDYGLVYAGGVDEEMGKRLLAQYHFTDNGVERQCYEHLKIGNKGSYDPTLNARIYFCRVEEGNIRLVVGHVGRHLDSSSTT